MSYLHDITYCANDNCSKKDTCVRYQELLKAKKDPNVGLVSITTASEDNCDIYWKD